MVVQKHINAKRGGWENELDRRFVDFFENYCLVAASGRLEGIRSHADGGCAFYVPVELLRQWFVANGFSGTVDDFRSHIRRFFTRIVRHDVDCIILHGFADCRMPSEVLRLKKSVGQDSATFYKVLVKFNDWL